MGTSAGVNWTDVIIAIAALWGAFTGTIAILLQLRNATRPKLVVSLYREEVSPGDWDPEDGYPPSEDVVFLDITNLGERRIKVEAVSIEWGRRSVSWSDLRPGLGNTPVDVAANNHVCFGLTDEDFLSGLYDHGARGRVYVRAAVRDATHKLYRSRKLALDI